MRILMQAIVAGLMTVATAGGAVQAQSYPSRAITLVVPFAAGGPSDAIARLIGQSMSETLGQQVVIENVAGAGGTSGAARVAKADPDGYTLLIHHVALAAGASLYPKLAYDTATAFAPIGLVNSGPMVLMSKKDYLATDAAGLTAKLKADGMKATLAHAGVGSNSHLCTLLLQKALGVTFTQVAYRGTGPAMNDLMSGQVDVLCDQSTTAVPQIEGNTVKGFAVTSQERLPVLKDLPTLQETGLKDFAFTIWHGIYAPAGTSPDVVAKLNAALQKALDDKNVQTRFAEVGTQLFPTGERTPAAHQAQFAKEIATWRAVIGENGPKN
ncbi:MULTISPECIES: tripartite tricarboxylate transporter substrate-binding protein [unclassified Chelatococcus]|uniref:tripartite tricarboxylate transporter substrate-binding protein n=1 Tax=unclassified Chelatococcus TaxID=2638111 RepID=UPI001BCF0CE3|nr:MULTISPECIES: tripartite tricarboxylate transporter substrate-binding protein [unclassified Chelatococcus]MBS7699651.1 tripartite tricarboxylate transporter substrate binding protein BugD [Chelatococcus sp. YT9]MBX3557151.1 tripartite tricarboxylate transporter substrate binding protein BugD [Chelatococcus sp.]